MNNNRIVVTILQKNQKPLFSLTCADAESGIAFLQTLSGGNLKVMSKDEVKELVTAQERPSSKRSRKFAHRKTAGWTEEEIRTLLSIRGRSSGEVTANPVLRARHGKRAIYAYWSGLKLGTLAPGIRRYPHLYKNNGLTYGDRPSAAASFLPFQR